MAESPKIRMIDVREKPVTATPGYRQRQYYMKGATLPWYCKGTAQGRCAGPAKVASIMAAKLNTIPHPCATHSGRGHFDDLTPYKKTPQ